MYGPTFCSEVYGFSRRTAEMVICTNFPVIDHDLILRNICSSSSHHHYVSPIKDYEVVFNRHWIASSTTLQNKRPSLNNTGLPGSANDTEVIQHSMNTDCPQRRIIQCLNVTIIQTVRVTISPESFSNHVTPNRLSS